MAWFKKKADPLSERSRMLNAEIAALESKIKKFESQIDDAPSGPRVRSTAIPRQGKPATPAAPSAPVFEKVDTNRLMQPAEPANTPEHFNEFGVRKYDLPGLLRRLRDLFRGPSTNNPKLVSYLAAGGIQGMRPLRREKRIARNRTIALAIMLLLILLGMIVVLNGR
ncbi:MAG: hypothetical protein RLY20_2718 [Verrucomicrobiota bacterium]|jgi:hypothetical protein